MGDVLDIGSEVRDLVRLLEQAYRDPRLARLAALGRKHLGQIRVVGRAKHLEPSQDADPLRSRPQQGRQSLRDFVLDRFLFLRPQERDRLLAAGLRLDGEAKEELVAMFIDRATLEPVLGRLDGLIGVRQRVDDADLDLALGRALVGAEEVTKIAFVGDEVLDKAGQCLPRGLGEIERDLDWLDPFLAHPIENLVCAVRKRVNALTRDVGGGSLQDARQDVDGEDGDEAEETDRERARTHPY